MIHFNIIHESKYIQKFVKKDIQNIATKKESKCISAKVLKISLKKLKNKQMLRDNLRKIQNIPLDAF